MIRCFLGWTSVSACGNANGGRERGPVPTSVWPDSKVDNCSLLGFPPSRTLHWPICARFLDLNYSGLNLRIKPSAVCRTWQSNYSFIGWYFSWFAILLSVTISKHFSLLIMCWMLILDSPVYCKILQWPFSVTDWFYLISMIFRSQKKRSKIK